MCKNKETKANKDIVKMLIEYGADPLIKNKKDKNVFEFAEKFPLGELIAEVKVRRKVRGEGKEVGGREKVVRERVETPKDKRLNNNDRNMNDE